MAERRPAGTCAATLDEITRRLERLSVSRRDPHAFHEEKSELIHDLRRVTDLVRLKERPQEPR